MPNLALNYLSNVAAIDKQMIPFLEQKKAELAKLKSILKSRLQLWCLQFNELPLPLFDLKRGFGFSEPVKHNIFSDDITCECLVEGGNLRVTFENGPLGEHVLVMFAPLRYLDDEMGEIELLQDANELKNKPLGYAGIQHSGV